MFRNRGGGLWAGRLAGKSRARVRKRRVPRRSGRGPRGPPRGFEALARSAILQGMGRVGDLPVEIERAAGLLHRPRPKDMTRILRPTGYVTDITLLLLVDCIFPSTPGAVASKNKGDKSALIGKPRIWSMGKYGKVRACEMGG